MTLEEKLKNNDCSVTKSRQVLFTLLKNSDKPMSIGEIIKQSSSQDRSTIYRNIELYEKLDIVKRVWFGFKSKIELSEEFEDHHHHIVCEHCGLVKDIGHSQLELMIKTISSKAGYSPTSHHVEILGLCENCQK